MTKKKAQATLEKAQSHKYDTSKYVIFPDWRRAKVKRKKKE